jgi:imidazolonepropionase-like amidohydrolase
MIADGVSYAKAAARHGAAPDEASVRAALRALKERGVGFFRDGGDKFGVSLLARELAPEYGVDYRTPCYIIHRAGYYGELYGKAYRDMREARELIREAKRAKADFIKIAVSGMLDFASGGRVMGEAIGKDEIRELTKTAQGEGLCVMAHCNGAENVKNALEAGITSLEHGFWTDREGADMLAETGAVWVPTLAPVANLLNSGEARASGNFSESALRGILSRHGETLAYARGRGVLIASGSDCGARGVAHGKGTDDEIMYLAQLGIDPSPANARVSELFRRP